MSALWQDTRVAWRRLRAKPSSSFAAVLALSLGIGFSTANYSVADALLFRPLPVPDIDQVVLIGMQREGRPGEFHSVSAAGYVEWRSTARSLQTLAATRNWGATLTGSGEPVQLSGARVTASYFDAMRIQPLLGRFFHSDEEKPGRDESIVLAHKLWERQFASDPAVIGRTLELSGHKYVISGALPKGFNYPRAAEFLVPLALEPGAWADAGSFYLRAIARLKPEVSIKQAGAEFATLSRNIASRRPDTNAKLGAKVILLRDRASGEHAPSYTRLVMASVLFLLLIACLNVANLQFARVLARAREMAIRAALGASRWRILRQVLIECLLLAFGGAACGLLVSAWCLDAIRTAMPPEIERFLPGWQSIRLSGHALFWTILTAVFAGLVSGIGPAVWLSRVPVAGALLESGRSATGSAARQRLRTGLVISETALALVLLVGACLMVKSFRSIGSLDVGIEPEKLLSFRISLPDTRYPGSAAAARFQDQLLASLESFPGVHGAAVVSNLPYSGSSNSAFLSVEGRPDERGAQPVTQTQVVSPGYFRLFGLPTVQGKSFSGSESPDSQPTVLVSEAFARQFFPGTNPVGRRIQLGGGGWLTIAGVVADVLHDFTDRSPAPVVYRPHRQFSWNAFDVIVRSSGDPAALAPAVRQAIRSIDAAQPVFLVRSYRKLMDDNIFGISYVAANLAMLSLVALFLASLGIYGVMAYVVGERTREFGIRLALGAQRRQLIWLILGRGILIATVSLAIGLPASFAIARMLSGLIYGVSPADLLAFAGMPALLIAALLAASLLPALRASRTDPLSALHHE